MIEGKENSRHGISLPVQMLIWALLFGLLILLGIGLVHAQQGTIQPGDKVPDFSLALFTGYEYNSQPTVKIGDLRGMVVFINYWASWCMPCEQEAPVLEQVWEYYQPSGKVVFLESV
jgi:thiol:disulfide interchange protein